MIEFIDVCKNFDEQAVLKNINLTIFIKKYVLYDIMNANKFGNEERREHGTHSGGNDYVLYKKCYRRPCVGRWQ